MIRTHDQYLSRIARKAWPGATVWVESEQPDAKRYVLERPARAALLLGEVFGPAREYLRALVSEAHGERSP